MSNLLTPQSDREFQSILGSHRSDNKLVVVDFNATWCGPCRMMAPIVEDESRKRPHVIFVSADTDKCNDSAHEYEVTSIPCFVFLKNGQVLTRFTGADRGKFIETLNTHGKEERPLFSGVGHKLTDDGPSPIDQEALSSLVEMGFPRDIAYQALLERKTLEAALEWIEEYQSRSQPQVQPQVQPQPSLGAEKKKDDDDVVMKEAQMGAEEEKKVVVVEEKKGEEKEEEEEECKFNHDSFCDECYEPIVGILYRCEDCEMDFCSKCIESHEKDHNITKSNGTKVVKYNESFSESASAPSPAAAAAAAEKKEEEEKKEGSTAVPSDVIMGGSTIPPEGECTMQYYCDGCGKEIKSANRYRCETCANYDLCEECYKKGIHDKTHKFKEFPVFTLENYKQIISERRQKQAELREKEAQEKEIRRIREGKASQDDRERAQELRHKRDAEIKKREYEEQKRYELDVLRKIERDRQERLKRMNPSAAAAQKSVSEPVAKQAPPKVYSVSNPASACTVAKLKIRLPDGTNFVNSFDPDATLKTVFFWVQERYSTPTGLPFCFKCMSPSAHFTFDQMDITLRQAKLVPSAVLIVTNK